MIELVRGKWDKRFSHFVYKRFTHPVCKATGKSSKIVSRRTYFIGVLVTQADTLSDIVFSKGIPWSHWIIFIWFFFIFRNIWRTMIRIGEIEDSVNYDEGYIQLKMDDLKMLKSYCWDRSFWFGFSIILFLIELPFLRVSFFLVGIFICSVAMYTATHFEGSGKSVLARIQEKISNWAANLKPAPILIPAPTRYNPHATNDHWDHLHASPFAGDDV
jgi:hypothetical protein